MGNNNTTDLREEESSANEPPEKSSPGSVLEDDKIIENQLVSTGKVDGLEDVTKLPGHTDVSDKISDKREQPEPPPEIAVKGGQAEDDEKLKAIPARSPGNNGNISGDYVRVGKDEQFASTDLTTKDFLEHETSLDSASDLKEASIAMERSNDIPQVSNLMENAKMQETEYLSNVSADLVPETIFEHVEEAEEMGLESSEAPHLEGNRMEEMTMRLKDMEFLDGDEGMLTEKKVTELDRDGPVSEVEEGDTDGCRNGMSDEIKRTLASNEPNHIQARPDEVLVLDHASSTKREQPKASMEIATKGGQVEECEEQRAIPTSSSTDYGNSLGSWVQVEMDDRFASTDPSTKDSLEPETSVDSESDPEETSITVERSNDSPQELNSMESGNKQDSRFSRDLRTDFVPQTIPEPIKRDEEMEFENGEVLHLEGNQKQEVGHMEFLCAGEGISAETKVTESDINVLASIVEEGETDGSNGLFDQMNYVTTLLDVRPFQCENVGQCQVETGYPGNVSADFVPETISEHVEEAEEMGLENSEVPHLESNRMEEMTMRLKDMEFLDGDEGMLTEKKVTESDRNRPRSEKEEDDTDGCWSGMSDEMQGTFASNELNHIQARPDEVLVLDHASNTGREEPKVSMEIATKGGQVEDYEEQRAIPTNSSTDYGNSPGCCVQVEMDDQFASTDPNTKDSPEPETSVDSTSDPEEAQIAMERSNDVPQELNVMENGNKQDSRFSRDLTPDFDAQTIPEPIKRAEEMELENGEVLHLDGNQMEKVADMELPCADEGISAETKVTELDINVLASVVEEGKTDDRNGLFDQMNYVTTLLDVRPFQCENVGQCHVETGYLSNVSADFVPEMIFEHVEEAEEMGLENSEVPHMEFLDGDEGMLTEKKVTESDRNRPLSEAEEDDTDGCWSGMSDEMKGTLASNELNRIQARPDEVLVLDHASNTGREEPKVSMEIATKGGQVEDYEEQRAIPTNSSTDHRNSPGCCVQVEMDDQFASMDPNTKDSLEPETSVDSASDPEEAQIAMERLNDVPQELNVMENGNKQDSRFLSDLTLDFDARTIPEPIKRAEGMELENVEIVHLEDNQMEKVADMELPCADEGISAETKVTESDINVPARVAEEVENNGRNRLFDQMNYVTTLSDVRPFQSDNVEQCQDEAELVTVNSFEVNDLSEASRSDGMDGHQEEEESTVKNILLDEKEAMEAPFLVGDDTVDREEAAERFIPSPEAGIFDDEESQSSVSSSSTVPNSEATVSNFEFEKPRMDLPEIPGTSLVFMVEAKAPEDGGDDQFPRSEISGTLNGDSISSNILPQMQKSPSFDLDIRSESDQTPLLFQDKEEILIPTLQEQEKAVTAERSDSEKSKVPLLRFTEREENEGEEVNAASKPREQESQGGKEKAVVRVKERRSFGSLLFGNCICCGTDRLEYPSV